MFDTSTLGTATVVPLAIIPSATASLRSIDNPSSVPHVDPSCCTILCSVSVPPSATACLTLFTSPVGIYSAKVEVIFPPEPRRIGIEFKAPVTTAVVEAEAQSEALGTFLPFAKALAIATGPTT